LALKKAINRLREVLGDSAESPRFIETVPRRGYRFLGPVEAAKPSGAEAAAPATPTRRKFSWPLTASLAVALIGALLLGLNVDRLRMRIFAKPRSLGVRSIAVLPLQNLSNDPNQDYFSDGITDALTTNLAQIGALRVISRTSAMHFKGTRETLPEIGRELNVDAVVEGSITRSENRVRITAQLIDAQTDRHLWAKSYERELKDVLALQDEVARDIATEIRVRLTPEVQSRLSNSRVVDPEVYEDYLRGRYYWNRRTPEDVYRGIDYFQRAIAKDSNYALGYAGLADSYIVLAGYRIVSPKKVLPLAKAAALKALETDESLAEARTPLADFRAGYDFDFAGAEKEFKRAIETNPSYATAHSWYGEDVLAPLGRFPEALSELRQAEALDPLSRAINAIHGYVLYLARDNGAAITQLRKTLELDENFPQVHMYLGRVYVQNKMLAEALAEFKKADDLSRGEAFYRAWLSYGYAVSGQTSQARKILDELEKLSKQGYVSPYDIAAVWMGLGEREQTLKWLEAAYEDRAAYIEAINVEPIFEGLRSEPRFQDLVRRMNLPVDSTDPNTRHR
jgi:TolB-like protein/Flp pilus assembly protein TadD